MRDVMIIGVGRTMVGELWDRSLRDLAAEAAREALSEARPDRVDALYVGNMLSGELCGQENLAALVADYAGLLPVEAVKIEAACASGAAAVRAAYISVAAGVHDVALVVGVEKMTDVFADSATRGLATAADQDYEASHGLSFVALNALLMRRYMHEHHATHEDFAVFPVVAHENGARNCRAMFREPVTAEQVATAPTVASPITVLDAAPICDGAAAVVLSAAPLARRYSDRPIRIAASAAATDTIALASRRDTLALDAATVSCQLAYRQAGRAPDDINLFELHDAFSIMTALSLEAAGFCKRGHGVAFGREGRTAITGDLPIATLGGLKARGHPVGASGVFQAAEATMQLRGDGGATQVKGAHVAMTQNIGGHGSVVITHILEN